METIVSGSSEKRVEHSRIWGPVGLMASMLPPLAMIGAGILGKGLGAVDWLNAVSWGIIATAVFTAFGMMGTAMGMTKMDIADLLGSMAAEPGTAASKGLGLAIHHANGVILAVAWVYASLLAGLTPNLISGLIWGAAIWVLALLMFSTIGSVHPAIVRGDQTDPGPAGINFGGMTPIGSLMGHLVYGAVLGLGYSLWPF